jgi:D-amino-acid dehydrogenase
MKVVVLGAGVIGTTCAHYLSEAGFEVAVLDRRSGPAQETSFANAGGICPGFAGPWAAPGMLGKIAGWLGRRDAPLSLRPTFDPHQWAWLLRFARNCTAERFRTNKERMQRIAHYSKACLVALRHDTGISYDGGTGGVLQLFRNQQDLDGAAQAARVLASFGVAHQIVDAAEIRAIEPALAGSGLAFAGGLHLPQDETGDCHLFTTRLAERLRERGVSFHFDTTAERLVVEGDALRGVMTNHGLLQADAYVMALGSFAPLLLRDIGIKLPIYPVKGYALTIPIERDDRAPRSSVMDESSKLMVTRLGSRLRAAGIAEIGGYGVGLDTRKCEFIRDTAAALFPGAGDYRGATYWTGLRPMTPDGPPHLGKTRYRNLYLNVGQGSNGWTQACGCGRIVADVVAGRQPEIDLSGMTAER